MNKTQDKSEKMDQITLTMEDDTEVICDVIAVFPVNDKNYIALLPVGDDPESEIILCGLIEKDADDYDLVNIEDDEEFEAVSEAFDELLDEADFDAMFDEDDADAPECED